MTIFLNYGTIAYGMVRYGSTVFVLVLLFIRQSSASSSIIVTLLIIRIITTETDCHHPFFKPFTKIID